jgi:hypothetical protein
VTTLGVVSGRDSLTTTTTVNDSYERAVIDDKDMMRFKKVMQFYPKVLLKRN